LAIALVYKQLLAEDIIPEPTPSIPVSNTQPNSNMWATYRQNS
jgi:hypothetical protein